MFILLLVVCLLLMLLIVIVVVVGGSSKSFGSGFFEPGQFTPEPFRLSLEGNQPGVTLGEGAPFAFVAKSGKLVLGIMHEMLGGDLLTIIVEFLLVVNVGHKSRVRGCLVTLEEVDKEVIGALSMCL